MKLRRHLRAARLLSLALPLLLSGCGLFGGDEEEDAPAELVKFEQVIKVRQTWSASIGGDNKFLRLGLTPASDGARVFAAAHDGRVAAFEAFTGKRLWAVKTRRPLSGGPATDGRKVLLGTSDGDVLALDAETGASLWSAQVGSEVLAAPAISAGLAFIRTVDGRLIALSLADGAEAWFVQQSVPRLSVRGTAAPVVAGTSVVAGFDNGRVAAYAIGDGSPLWDVLLNPPGGRTEVDRLVDINAALQLVGPDLYVPGYQGQIASMALESGQVLWSREVSTYSGIAADLLNVYVANATGEMVALSRRSGRENWRAPTLLNRDLSGPAAWRNSVVVGDFEGYLHWFNATTGDLQARVRAGSKRITSAPLVVNDYVYVLTDGGKLFAFTERESR